MTVLVAVKNKDGVTLASDKIGTWSISGHQQNLSKVRAFENIVFSWTGDGKHINTFGMYCELHKPESTNVYGISRYIVDFINFAKDLGLYTEVNGFVACKEQGKWLLYSIHGNGVELVTSGYRTNGCGKIYAEVALYCNKTPKEAVEITNEMNAYCGGGVDILELKDD